MGPMRPDTDKVFDTREEAERARDRLNRTPPEYGHGPWYLGGPVEGKWWVIRWRGLMAEEVGDVMAYEEDHRQAFERIAMAHDFWRDVEGIRFDAVQLDGEFPDTKLVLLFRSVPKEPFGVADVNCVFGVRWPIWPASDQDPAEEASELEPSFMEFLGTDPRAYRVRRGPCDPGEINWLD
jgi:hypothetical protein